MHYILWAVVTVEVVFAWLFRGQPVIVLLMGIGVALGLFNFCFMHLRVEDEGDWLAVRYGPVPLFSKRIRYSDITSVDPARSLFIDGWGIHYLPWRGWTYNLWGFDCVELRVDQKQICIGSDDVPNLVEFLKTKVGTH